MIQQSIKGKRISLIGGAGFIGHQLALSLKKMGADVQVIDSLQVNNLLSFTSSSEEIQNRELYLKIIHQRLELLYKEGIPLCVQDSRDYHILTRLLADFRPQVIIHLAAVAHANRSNKDPYSTFDHSLRTLENTLDIARASDLSVEHFVFFSSSTVYGNFTSDIVTENTLCEPLGIYGALKYAGEKLVIAYNQVFGLPYTIIRPSALYGERCVSRRVGQVFIENAMQGLDITINGDGTDRLDFTYIGDLVQGMIKVLENEKSKNQVFNLTYGQSRSMSEMVDILIEYFSDVNIKYLPKDRLMPDRGTLSIDKAKKLLNYNPQHPLEKGFVDYINWYKSIWQS